MPKNCSKPEHDRAGEKLGFQVKTRPEAQEFELVMPLASYKGGVSRASQKT